MVAVVGTHIPDRRKANKAEAAEFFGISPNSLDKWIARGAPVVQRGLKGEPWIIDLLAVAHWKFDRDTEQAAAAAGVTIMGQPIDPETLPPRDRKEWFESELKRRQLQEKDRELIPAAEVEEVLATAFAAVVQGIRAIPDRLERTVGMDPEAADTIAAQIDGLLEELADRLEKLAPGEGGE